MLRLVSFRYVLLLALTLAFDSPARATDFTQFVESMWPDAKARGITRATFDSATRGLTPDNRFDRLTKKQPEFANPIGKYFRKRVSKARISAGRKKVKRHGRLLRRIERKTGVDPYIIAAIWGMETAYGAFSGRSDILQSLATLAWKKYRGDFFKGQFLDALTIMQNERIPRQQMRGSWAGGIGQPQFIPSSFLSYAIDFDGDGRRDLWKSVPDALGSAGNYLKQKGWKAGEPWGYPVRLPKSSKRMAQSQAWQDWDAAGVRRLDGGKLPRQGVATLFFPSGEEGQAFLVTTNYEVIKSYNFSDAYALSVAILADTLRGRKIPALKWPTRTPLTKSRRSKVQTLLAKAGYAVPNRIGRIDHTMRMVLRDYQLASGLTADGHPDAQVLRHLESR